MSSDEEPIHGHKRKPDVSQKTPTAILQEFCVKEGEVLMFEDVPHQPNSKIFSCKAIAFEMGAIGSGRSKKEAKHDACANLIAELSQLRCFAGKLSVVPPTPHAPHPTTDGDAVGTLLDICVQRELPLPKFTEIQAYGEPHRPMFTVKCQLSSICRTGTFSTKKGAKQIAARAVLDIVQNFSQNEEQQQIATMPLSEPPEKLFITYRELKKSGIKPKTTRLRDRHRFFLRLPVEDRIEANKYLLDDSGIYGTSKDIVDLVCDALKLKYDIHSVPNDVKGRKIFALTNSNHDCVLNGKEPDLYDEIIDHFKIMLNLNENMY